MDEENLNEKLKRVDIEIRISKLKREAERIAGGKVFFTDSTDCPPEVEEQFWQRIVDFEKMPKGNYFQELVNAGFELTPPDAMNEAELRLRLWLLVEALAGFRVFLENTNHLNDRALYSRLWDKHLREETVIIPLDEHSAFYVDLVGSGSDEDIQLYLRYFADDESRAQWLEDFPDYQMPTSETPPYTRDRDLPGARYGHNEHADLLN